MVRGHRSAPGRPTETTFIPQSKTALNAYALTTKQLRKIPACCRVFKKWNSKLILQMADPLVHFGDISKVHEVSSITGTQGIFMPTILFLLH